MKKGFFGEYGGQYVPDTLLPALEELEAAYEASKTDTEFQQELTTLLNEYVGRPSPLYHARNLSQKYNTTIYLKREDLNHTGAHKINNTLGQVLLAKKMGKTRVIAETGAGQHGVATATVCALMKLNCVIFMGETDIQRQALNVYRMKLLGAEVVPVSSGSKTLKDATTAAIRDWMGSVENTHYIIGSVLGPHPYPTVVRDFQCVIGKETKSQILQKENRLPTHLIACVGGGSNATGFFHPFFEDKTVNFIAAEAGGKSLNEGEHAASLSKGKPGILHGAMSYLIQTKEGQIGEVHSISAGLDYPGVSPELSDWKDKGRLKGIAISDEEALKACAVLSREEGIIPALESSHAVAVLEKETFSPKDLVVINISGRGDKDMQTIRERLG